MLTHAKVSRVVGIPDVSRRRVVRGSISLNMVTPAIVESFNVASITDNGAGDFTVTWLAGNVGPTTCAYIFGARSNTAAASAQAVILTTTAPTSTTVRIGGGSGSSTTGIDVLRVLMFMIGDG